MHENVPLQSDLENHDYFPILNKISISLFYRILSQNCFHILYRSCFIYNPIIFLCNKIMNIYLNFNFKMSCDHKPLSK